MTQEQKDLLLKDLCARLTHGVKARVYNHWRDDVQDETITIENLHRLIETFSIEDIKPYLFPLSSMTEEERIAIGNEFAYGQPHKAMDILHQRHIDYKGLIPMGLAIDATGKNIY